MTDRLAAAAPTAPLRRPRLLPWAPSRTLLLLAGPVLAGTLGVLLPAFGWFPPLGGTALSLVPWRDLLTWPGLTAALRLTVTTALLSTGLSLACALLIVAAWQGTAAFRLIERALSPLLSVPHAAAAFGLAFLIAPSGWVMRWLSPWATGLERPPDVLMVGDPWGLSLVAGLVIKETPFLLLMILAALPQVEARRGLLLARALGHGRVTAWFKVVLPQVYPQIRLPVLAVLAYSASAVDVAAILGPVAPPPLAVQITAWTNDPDLARRFTAAAAATLLLALTLALVTLWLAAERAVAVPGRRWVEGGGRGGPQMPWRVAGLGAAVLTASAVFAGLAGLAVWSVAGLWRFPDALPQGFQGAVWQRALPAIADAAAETAIIGAAAMAIGLLLVLACLEAEHRHGLGRPGRALWLLYLPLLVPQVGFLTGLQALALATGVDGGRWPVIAAHAVFVTPYIYLSLAEPWRAWDRRAGLAAAALGASPDRILWAVRMPMLLRPVMVAAAVGFAVSVGQYLPTLLIGGGRVATLTTEAVALAAGGDRRLIGVYALAQAAAPLLGFSLALAIPALAFRNRRALR
jgi:putative thiamine transport system permease protein